MNYYTIMCSKYANANMYISNLFNFIKKLIDTLRCLLVKNRYELF